MPFVEFKLGGGLNTKASPTDIADNELQQALGCRLDRLGAVSSDQGRRTWHDYEDGPIRGVVDIYRSDIRYRVVKANETLYEGLDEIGTFLGDGYLSGASYDRYAYFADGVSVKRWDGTTLEAVGLDAPTAAMVATPGSGHSGDLNPGNYKYYYTFFNGVAESNFSPAASCTVAAGDDGVVLTGIAVGGATVTARRVYRTDVGGKAKYFLTEIADNTTTTFTDTEELPEGADVEAVAEDDPTDIVDAEAEGITNRDPAGYAPTATLKTTFPKLEQKSTAGDGTERQQVVMSNLGALADWTDHTPPPSDLRHLVFHREQFFGISGNDVVFSRVGEPEHWPVFNRFRPGRRASEQVLSLLPLGADIMVYTDSAVYRLTSLGSGYTAVSIRLEQIDSPVGITGEWGVADLMLGGASAHLFMATTGLYLCDGRQAVEVGYALEGLFTDSERDDFIRSHYRDKIVMVSYRDKAWIGYNGGAATIVADFQDPQSPKFTTLPYGYVFLHRERRDHTILGGDIDGVLYTLPFTYTSGQVRWAPKTKAYTFGGKMKTAQVSEVILDANLGGLETLVTVELDDGRTFTRTLDPADAKRQEHRFYLPTEAHSRSVAVTLDSTGDQTRHWYGVGFTVEGEADP